MTKSAYTPGDLLRDLLAAKKQTANAAAVEIEARGYGASGSAQSAGFLSSKRQRLQGIVLSKQRYRVNPNK